MVKKPRSLKILGHRVKIAFVSELNANDEDLLGEFTINPYLIKVVDNAMWEQTLLHEVVHAILRISGCAELIDPAVDEAITQAVESGLGQLYTLRQS